MFAYDKLQVVDVVGLNCFAAMEREAQEALERLARESQEGF